MDDRVFLDARTADFAGDHDAVGRGQGLAGYADLIGVDAGSHALAEEQVDDFVGNPVTHLVGVAFRDGFTGKKIAFTGHASPPMSDMPTQWAHCHRVPIGFQPRNVLQEAFVWSSQTAQIVL